MFRGEAEISAIGDLLLSPTTKRVQEDTTLKIFGRTTHNARITGGKTAERSGAVFPVRVHAHVGCLLFCYFINSRLKAMMTMPPMRPKRLSCPLP